MTTSYFVRYECETELSDEFVNHYRTVHVPILLSFPGILAVHLHLPIRSADTQPVASGTSSLLAQLIFDSPEDLDAALRSPERNLARIDFNEHLTIDGEVYHQAMTTVAYESTR